MHKKFILALSTAVLAISGSKKTYAQADGDFIERQNWSIGITAGTTDLWGDVGTKNLLDHYLNEKYLQNYTKPMVGLFARRTFHPSFSVRGSFNYGILSAGDDMNINLAKKADKYESDEVQRYQRNLNVKTQVAEASLMLEISPFRFSTGSLSRWAHMSFQPYLMVGISGYYFNAQGLFNSREGKHVLNGNWIDLYDLHIEGDGWAETGIKKYSKYQIAIPMGIGAKWDLSPKMTLGLEYTYRYCMTDYLDGVSAQYIDPKYYDKYLSSSNAAIAREMADKSWQLDPSKYHQPGEMRGNKKGSDGFSTISVILYYKFKPRNKMWWQ
jgi:hypothetical protein